MDVIEALRDMSKKELDEIAKTCDINTKGMTKQQVIDSITKAIKQELEARQKYTKIEQLGKKGKEGTVFHVKDKKKNSYAMKEFSKTKSEKNLEREAIFLKKASEFGISPQMHDYDVVYNYIIMEKLDKNLFDHMKESKGKLSVKLQKDMIKIFKTLDKISIFHADPNPLNFMFDSKGDLKIIDFGFAKVIDDKLIKEHGSTPNMKYMPMGFILKMADFVQPSTFTELLKHVSDEDKARLNLLNK